MIIEYYGHDLFTLTLESGAVIATDPYSGLYQYPERSLRADVCTVTHHHYDHDSVQILQGSPVILDSPGPHRPLGGVTVTGFPCFHDEVEGKKRGENLIFVIEAEDLRVAHLGDLGHPLSADQVRALGPLDVLFLPVGGYYTIDAPTAFALMQALRPTVTIPMHYRTRFNPDMPIQPLAPFLALCGVSPEPMALCRITAEDISERPGVLVMTTAEGL